MTDEITITEGHIRLLERTYVGWDGDAYDGAPAVNVKRPYGNGDVLGDVFEITQPELYKELSSDEDAWDEWNPADHPELERTHREMEYVIQIALNLAGKGQLIEAGATYYRPDRYDTRTWARRVDG